MTHFNDVCTIVCTIRLMVNRLIEQIKIIFQLEKKSISIVGSSLCMIIYCFPKRKDCQSHPESMFL